MSIFKAYDIRGVVGRSWARPMPTPSAAPPRTSWLRLACWWAAMRGRARRSLPRRSWPESSTKGRDVLDAGLVSTPMVYFGVEHRGCRRRRSASRPPTTRARYNGFKLCREHAIPIGGASGLREIEALAGRRSEAPRHLPAAAPCGPSRCAPAYVDAPRTRWRRSRARALRVAIDCGNGMAAVGLEPLLARLPLTVERLYFEPDGSFPNHPADPARGGEPSRRRRGRAAHERRLRRRLRRRRGPRGLRRRGGADRVVGPHDGAPRSTPPAAPARAAASSTTSGRAAPRGRRSRRQAVSPRCAVSATPS